VARRPKTPTLEGVTETPHELLTPRQLAGYLQISLATISRHLRRGLPHERIGGQIRFDRNAVLRFYRKVS